MAVMRLVRRINKTLEDAILRHPEQYLWIHDRYREPPPEVLQEFATDDRAAS